MLVLVHLMSKRRLEDPSLEEERGLDYLVAGAVSAIRSTPTLVTLSSPKFELDAELTILITIVVAFTLVKLTPCAGFRGPAPKLAMEGPSTSHAVPKATNEKANCLLVAGWT